MMHSCTVQKHQVHVYIYSHVCFHGQPFANLVKPRWYITEPVEPLGSTNQNWWDVKPLPMSVLTYYVDCAHLCHPQRHSTTVCVQMAVRDHLQLAHLPPPAPPLPLTHTLIYDTHNITEVVKTISNPAVNAAHRVGCETVATYKTALLIQQLRRGYNGSTGEAQLLQYFKMVYKMCE